MALRIDPRYHTRKRIEQAIWSYIESSPDAEVWKDKFQSSFGTMIVELLAGVTELWNYKVESRSRESYIGTARTTSASYLLAQMLSYNPNRKKHAFGKVLAEIKPNAFRNLVIPKWLQIGTSELPFIVDDNYDFIEGERFLEDISIRQGEWTEAEFSREKANMVGQDWEVLYIPEEKHMVDQYEVYIDIDGVEFSFEGIENPNDGLIYRLVDKMEIVDERAIIVKTD